MHLREYLGIREVIESGVDVVGTLCLVLAMIWKKVCCALLLQITHVLSPITLPRCSLGGGLSNPRDSFLTDVEIDQVAETSTHLPRV